MQRLVGQPPRHRPVADHGDDRVALAHPVPGEGHAQRGGNRGGGVAGAHMVVGAVGAFEELAQPPPQPILVELGTAAGEHLVHVGLVPHVPGDAIGEKIELVEQGDGQLHDPQRGAQVPARLADRFDQELPALLCQGRELGRIVALDIPWVLDFRDVRVTVQVHEGRSEACRAKMERAKTSRNAWAKQGVRPFPRAAPCLGRGFEL